MKYKSDVPNLFIMADKVYENGTRDRIELGQFDKNGELKTENPALIQRLKELGYTPVNDDSPEDSKVTCKKCGAEFENKGLLMAHYRSEHPKK